MQSQNKQLENKHYMLWAVELQKTASVACIRRSRNTGSIPLK
jgi:hypothetical protein